MRIENLQRRSLIIETPSWFFLGLKFSAIADRVYGWNVVSHGIRSSEIHLSICISLHADNRRLGNVSCEYTSLIFEMEI